MTATRLLLGVRIPVTLDALRTACDRYLPSWHIKRAKDGYVSRVMEEKEISLSFSTKTVDTYDHSVCPKCSILRTMAGKISRGEGRAWGWGKEGDVYLFASFSFLPLSLSLSLSLLPSFSYALLLSLSFARRASCWRRSDGLLFNNKNNKGLLFHCAH